MSLTTNLRLVLTGADEVSMTFLEWRTLMNGTDVNSNMELIDKAIGELIASNEGKADGFSFNPDTGILSLTSGGTALGNASATINLTNYIDKEVSQLVTGVDTVTDKTKFAIGTAEQTLEVPSMEEFNQLKGDLIDQEGITDPISCKSPSDNDDSFYIVDSNGNIIFMVDRNGCKGVGIGETSSKNPFAGMKLITIGDSLSSHDKWQKYLVEWLGVTFDLDENINGSNGHAPMAVGGTMVRPNNDNSIYIRSRDAQYYMDNTNGTVIIVYAGQNDSIGTGYRLLGTIDDTPYLDGIVTDVEISFYSSYKGMIEYLLETCPKAKIYLMTQMQIWQDETGDIANSDTEAIRYEKVKAIKAIGEYYSLPVIDQWNNSGVNHKNANIYYPAVNNVHQNDTGYKRTAETAYSAMV